MADTYQRVTHRPVRDEEPHPEYKNDETIISLRDESPGITKTQFTLQYIVGLLSGLLLVRFILALFSANPGNVVVNLIYKLTDPFISPFGGVFNIDARSGNARFETETLVATIVYILVGMVIIWMLDIFRGRHNQLIK